ncbi:AAA family ATPase [Streptosporangium sp. KLBMP 9127]|nr:AAA family ATPase [Streptosporangium sp. KLBMP 9127]
MGESTKSNGPTLLCIVGPPAVGKMTVGYEIARLTGMKVFHNHLAIEPVLRFFEFGSEPFGRLVGEFRRRLFEEVAASDLAGLIFTYVWAFNVPADEVELDRYAAPFRSRGGRVFYLELSASREVRLERNEGELRLAEKPSKRDLAWSRRNLLELDAKYQLNSNGDFDGRADYLRIDNTGLSAAAVAERAIKHFGLR